MHISSDMLNQRMQPTCETKRKRIKTTVMRTNADYLRRWTDCKLTIFSSQSKVMKLLEWTDSNSKQNIYTCH